MGTGRVKNWDSHKGFCGYNPASHRCDQGVVMGWPQGWVRGAQGVLPGMDPARSPTWLLLAQCLLQEPRAVSPALLLPNPALI